MSTDYDEDVWDFDLDNDEDLGMDDDYNQYRKNKKNKIKEKSKEIKKKITSKLKKKGSGSRYNSLSIELEDERNDTVMGIDVQEEDYNNNNNNIRRSRISEGRKKSTEIELELEEEEEEINDKLPLDTTTEMMNEDEEDEEDTEKEKKMIFKRELLKNTFKQIKRVKILSCFAFLLCYIGVAFLVGLYTSYYFIGITTLFPVMIALFWIYILYYRKQKKSAPSSTVMEVYVSGLIIDMLVVFLQFLATSLLRYFLIDLLLNVVFDFNVIATVCISIVIMIIEPFFINSLPNQILQFYLIRRIRLLQLFKEDLDNNVFKKYTINSSKSGDAADEEDSDEDYAIDINIDDGEENGNDDVSKDSDIDKNSSSSSSNERRITMEQITKNRIKQQQHRQKDTMEIENNDEEIGNFQIKYAAVAYGIAVAVGIATFNIGFKTVYLYWIAFFPSLYYCLLYFIEECLFLMTLYVCTGLFIGMGCAKRYFPDGTHHFLFTSSSRTTYYPLYKILIIPIIIFGLFDLFFDSVIRLQILEIDYKIHLILIWLFLHGFAILILILFFILCFYKRRKVLSHPSFYRPILFSELQSITSGNTGIDIEIVENDDEFDDHLHKSNPNIIKNPYISDDNDNDIDIN